MAPDKMKEGMPMRQKVIMGLMVVVILIIVWQLKGMFGFGGTSAPEITPTQPAAKTPATSISNAPPATTPTPGQPTPMASQAPSANLQQVPLVGNELNNQDRQVQAQYIGKINELEELKISREIAETNQAIATAKLATVTAEKSISDLLTKPTTSQEVQPIPPGAYATQLGTPSAVTEQPTTPPPVTTPPPPPEIDYTVISVTMRYGKWNAVVGYQGHLFTVGVGDILPPDNSSVRSINQNGIVLRKSGKTRKVALVSSL